MKKRLVLKLVDENINALANHEEYLPKQGQNLVICNSKNLDNIPESIENIAYKMYKMDELIREVIVELRREINENKEEFSINLENYSKNERNKILELFKEMQYHFCSIKTVGVKDDHLMGKMALDLEKRHNFIKGSYMEIAVRQVVKEVLNELNDRHHKTIELYSNVTVQTKEGIYKNEFDLIIKNCTDNIYYAVEVKSGRNRSNYEEMAKVGKSYGIVPNRFLLVHNYLEKENIEGIEYAYEYFATDIRENHLKEKVKEMLEQDLFEQTDSVVA